MNSTENFAGHAAQNAGGASRKNLVIGGSLIALAAASLAGGGAWMLRGASAPSAPVAVSGKPATNGAAATSTAAPLLAAAADGNDTTKPAPNPANTAAAPNGKATPSPQRSAQARSNTGRSAGASETPLGTQPAVERRAAICTICGVVESVDTVQKKGEGTGLGAVAGGVLGGVVGHQIGGGKGKDAMTVIGAVGGGLAGHEVEKRQRATTSYRVKVRMEDGTTRTLEQAQSIAVGTRVSVDGQRLRARGDAPDAASTQPRSVQASTRGVPG